MLRPGHETGHRSIWTSLCGVAFEQAWVNASGIRTRYVHAGNRDTPTLIMLHGTASQAETFCNNIADHSKLFDCYAIDMLGTSYTDKPNRPYEIADYVQHIVDFMDALGILKTSFLGVSLGSWVAAQFAITHPQRTERLTLVAPAGHVADPVRMARIKESRKTATESPSWTAVRSVLERLVHNKEALFDDIVASRYTFYRQPEMIQAMRNILVLQDPEVRARNIIAPDQWGRIAAPTLVVGGINDNEADYNDAKAIAGMIPGSTLETIRDVGHWPHFEVPELFNSMNIAFLKSAR